MALTKEQISELKGQLKSQVANMSEPQKSEALKQIDSLSPEALETMIKQQQSKAGSQKPIFRMIIEGEMPSKKIDENKEAIAVLDVKPISKGHTIIISKKPAKTSKDLPSSALSLAKKISKRIMNKLKAKSTEIQTEFKFDEIIINIIPVYEKSLDLNSPRQDTNDKSLTELYNLLKKVKRTPVIKIKKPKSSQSSAIVLNRRIP